MNEFYEKWKNDKKYRTKIKLIAYTIFVVIVSIYALSINNKIELTNDNQEDNNNQEYINNNNKIDIPINYSYKININIDDEIYVYNGQKTINEEKIKKEANGIATNYRYYNNEYYIMIDDVYQLTTKETVYDVVNYNYINFESINKYLSKSQKVGNEYHVYLKDIVLGHVSEDYFTIKLNNNDINIDYTKLIQEFNHNINKYIVDIEIEK